MVFISNGNDVQRHTASNAPRKPGKNIFGATAIFPSPVLNDMFCMGRWLLEKFTQTQAQERKKKENPWAGEMGWAG